MRATIPMELERLYLWCKRKGYPFRVEFEREVVMIYAPRFEFAVTMKELKASYLDVDRLLDLHEEKYRQ